MTTGKTKALVTGGTGALGSAWTHGVGEQPWGLAAADLDGNGQVGPFDLALLLGAWGLCS